jgi:hypothetical protein
MENMFYNVLHIERLFDLGVIEMDNDLIFQGSVAIYLQGDNALEPTAHPLANEAHYFIGSEQTNLLVHDFRHEPIQAAQNALAGEDVRGFANIFNQPAWAVIRYQEQEESLDIELHEVTEGELAPILWLGILEHNEMPANPIIWEVLKPIGRMRTAFAALVPTHN